MNCVMFFQEKSDLINISENIRTLRFKLMTQSL